MGNSTPNSEILYLLMLFEKCPLLSPEKRHKITVVEFETTKAFIYITEIVERRGD